MGKFKVGDKVVPISKTVGDCRDLESSKNWMRAKEANQEFLYVQYFEREENAYVCNVNERVGSGCYFSENDLISYKKITKNQRITDCEGAIKLLTKDAQDSMERHAKTEKELTETKAELAELKLIVHELRGKQVEPSTDISVEDIIEFEGAKYRKVDRLAQEGDVFIVTDTRSDAVKKDKPYAVSENVIIKNADMPGEFRVYNKEYNRTPETVDVYELIAEEKPMQVVGEIKFPVAKTPNQQRAEVIEKAKAFVDENGGDEYHFEVDENERTVFAWKLVRNGQGYKAKHGIATCNHSDVYNEYLGRAISFGRAESLDVSEFEQAVQPTFEIGQYFTFKTYKGEKEEHQVIQVEGHKIWFVDTDGKEVYVTSIRNNANPGTYEPIIINDTNAIYGGDE